MTSFPPIPEDGLAEVLGAWAGRGYLYDAIAVPIDVRDERHWNSRDIRNRAHRVLLERITPILRRWPTRLSAWIDALPATRVHARVQHEAPFSGVSWTDSRQQFGWPPSAFVGREAERAADTLPVITLRWTLEYLLKVRANAIAAFPDVDTEVREQLDTAAELLTHEPLASAQGVMPGHPELMALRREGKPWGVVAGVAEEFRAIESSLIDLAWRLILPDDEIRWRLFHLAVLGVLLVGLRSAGCTVVSRRPLGGMTAGPNYTVTDALGLSWDLWFEAAGLWNYEDETSPYGEAASGVPGAGRALGADILLIQPGKRALIVECKYSQNPETVARNGYLQAVTYATEILSRLGGTVVSVVVGPSNVVATPAFTTTCVGRIGILPPDSLLSELARFLEESAELGVVGDLALRGAPPKDRMR